LEDIIEGRGLSVKAGMKEVDELYRFQFPVKRYCRIKLLGTELVAGQTAIGIITIISEKCS
jgi:hypothetical protein